LVSWDNFIPLFHQISHTELRKLLLTEQLQQEGMPMIVHSTALKIKPEDKPRLLEKLYSPDIIDLGRQMSMTSMMTVEGNAEPGLILSTSVWDSYEDARTAFSSPFYAELIKKLSPLFLARPERTAHKVLVYHPNLETQPGMFLNNTVIKVNPENVEALIKILYSDEVYAKSREFDGLGDAWALEPFEKPGTIFSISIWDKPESAHKVFADPFYADLLGRMKQLFVASPERFSFTVLQLGILKD
jgi:hypothetical protein